MTDEEAFEVGRNVATSPGKVIFQNELMQLIQYAPSTEQVHKRPLLIVPPWINKFYILDLQPKNSFIKWCVDQGHTVFVISWVNPREDLAHKDFQDYMLEGPLAALDAIEQATGEREANVLGFCIGGTLTAARSPSSRPRATADQVRDLPRLAVRLQGGRRGRGVHRRRAARPDREAHRTRRAISRATTWPTCST